MRTAPRQFSFSRVACGASFLIILTIVTSLRAADNPLTWGDQGDGTYKNPILKTDFSDPDITRVGSDFYMVASDFHFVGMQVLHSNDLVNWQIIGQVFNKLTMDLSTKHKYDQMTAYGEGTWAPSIRYHDGEFYVYVCTPYDGLFMWHTKNPAGPWSDTVTVKAIPQWEDPCPFWDDDGHAYLIHSHKGAGPLIVHKMSADGTTLLDDGQQIYMGKGAEGPKMYKRHGYYYVSFPEGGVATGGQVVIRSKNIYGPYERKQVLPDGSPHQGGMVELDNGQAWFISFKSTGWLGRVDYLNPVTWGADDWPVFGDNGKPVDQWKKPDVGATYPIERPETSDDFNEKTLRPIWQWNHNPELPYPFGGLLDDGLFFLARPADSIDHARNTLTQKIWDDSGVVDVKLEVSGGIRGGRAGLAFISGSTFNWVGAAGENAWQVGWQGSDNTAPLLEGRELWLRGTYNGDTAKLLYSLDGKNYVQAGPPVKLKFANWKGARVGLFCYQQGVNGDFVGPIPDARFKYFHYRYGEDSTRK